MGKKRKGGATPWKRCKKPRENVWLSDGALVRENSKFEEYYRLQKIVPDEEFDQFMTCLVVEIDYVKCIENGPSHNIPYQSVRSLRRGGKEYPEDPTPLRGHCRV